MGVNSAMGPQPGVEISFRGGVISKIRSRQVSTFLYREFHTGRWTSEGFLLSADTKTRKGKPWTNGVNLIHDGFSLVHFVPYSALMANTHSVRSTTLRLKVMRHTRAWCTMTTCVIN